MLRGVAGVKRKCAADDKVVETKINKKATADVEKGTAASRTVSYTHLTLPTKA